MWFWAKSSGFAWHNLLIHVYGVPPFLHVDCLNIVEDQWRQNIDPDDEHVELGKMIEHPDAKFNKDIEQEAQGRGK